MFTNRGRSPLAPSVRSAARSLLRAAALAGAFLSVSVVLPGRARAADTAADMKMTYAQFAKMDPMKALKMMDPDNKGYVTREEFLKFQAKLFDNIAKQNPDRVTMQEWRNQGPYQNTGQ